MLVISGMHITFIGGLVLALARFVTKRRYGQFALSLIILWSYTLMVGAEISVVRAALTFSFVALAPILFRRAAQLNAVGAAALALLVWRPADLVDPSFQLTVLSVLALVSIRWPLLASAAAPARGDPRAPHLPAARPAWLIGASQLLYWNERAWRADMGKNVFNYQLRKHKWATMLERSRLQYVLRYAAAALIVSASVQLALLPLLIVYFHRLSLASLILNLVVGALMAALSLVSLIALALSHVSLNFAAPFVWLAENLNWLMTHSVDPFARWGAASMRLPEYTGWPACLYLLYYVPLAVLIIALARWDALALPQSGAERSAHARMLPTRLAAVCLWVCLLLIVFHPWARARMRACWKSVFLTWVRATRRLSCCRMARRS
ncbi:MAG: ComEC/Rec2 family competence protein [Pyrinomonadaceae bacterium]